MTVKEAVSVLKYAKDISISWNGSSVPFDSSDMLMMDAYGRYKVEYINADEQAYEIGIAMRPIREGDA